MSDKMIRDIPSLKKLLAQAQALVMMKKTINVLQPFQGLFSKLGLDINHIANSPLTH